MQILHCVQDDNGVLRCYIVTKHGNKNVILNVVKDLQTLRYAQNDMFLLDSLINYIACWS